ncbi:hypothetical protein [Pendulispora rubella]
MNDPAKNLAGKAGQAMRDVVWQLRAQIGLPIDDLKLKSRNKSVRHQVATSVHGKKAHLFAMLHV